VGKELFIIKTGDGGGGGRRRGRGKKEGEEKEGEGGGRKRGRGYQGPISSRGEYRLLCFSLYTTNISFCYLGLDP
jgi:hypothetical protein